MNKQHPSTLSARRFPGRFSVFVSAGLFTLVASQLAAAESGATPSLNLWDLVRQGGWAMWPLGGCSLAMFFLLFHGWRETRPIRFVISGGNTDAPPTDATALGRTLARLDERMKDRPLSREDAERTAAESLDAEDHAVAQWIHYLNVVASVSPMIGLLGTVSGMIGAFQTISSGGMGKPELLAGDIGEALVTTATGLIIGIPAMIGYFVLRTRLANGLMAVSRELAHWIDRKTATQTTTDPASEGAAPGRAPRAAAPCPRRSQG